VIASVTVQGTFDAIENPHYSLKKRIRRTILLCINTYFCF